MKSDLNPPIRYAFLRACIAICACWATAVSVSASDYSVRLERPPLEGQIVPLALKLVAVSRRDPRTLKATAMVVGRVIYSDLELRVDGQPIRLTRSGDFRINIPIRSDSVPVRFQIIDNSKLRFPPLSQEEVVRIVLPAIEPPSGIYEIYSGDRPLNHGM